MLKCKIEKVDTFAQKLKKSKENREVYLKSLRDRIKAKEEHARVVRQNKRHLLPLTKAQEAR